jgi:hypothetical protein
MIKDKATPIRTQTTCTNSRVSILPGKILVILPMTIWRNFKEVTKLPLKTKSLEQCGY